MSQDCVAVHMRSEEYKIGWVHGFYDCVADDGAFYRRSNQFCFALGNSYGPDSARLYSLGYQDGTTARLAGVVRRWGHLVARETQLQTTRSTGRSTEDERSETAHNPLGTLVPTASGPSQALEAANNSS
jgi:hypothetical protein